MKILVVADVESAALWDFYAQNKRKDIDLIISCGDLKPEYLSFLTTMYYCDVLYVHDNHDGRYAKTPPEGCICIEDRIINYNGLRILGLGGSMQYSNGSHQYTEKQMRRRIRRLWPQLKRHKGFDILVTHSPAKGIHDGEDLPHQGFQCIYDLMDKYNPLYFVHGHVHLNYAMNVPRVDIHKQTVIINAYEKFLFDHFPKNNT